MSHPLVTLATVPPALHGLDIETDTADDGLDPAVSRIVAVAVSSRSGDAVFTGAERELLVGLDRYLRSLVPGVIVTWNGSSFDLPFLAARARRCGAHLGLELSCDPAIPLHHPPLPGHAGAFRARWHGHDHVDACRAWRALVPPGTSCSLKAVARSAGLLPVEVDSAGIHRLPLALLREYVASDATLARVLAERRWREVARFRDHHLVGGQLALPFG